MTQIAVHPYHTETGLSLSSNVASEYLGCSLCNEHLGSSPCGWLPMFPTAHFLLVWNRTVTPEMSHKFTTAQKDTEVHDNALQVSLVL